MTEQGGAALKKSDAREPADGVPAGVHPSTSPGSTGSALASMPMIWGYVMLVTSIVFNGLRYNLEAAALNVQPESSPPISPLGVVIAANYGSVVACLLTGWVWRQLGLTWGSLHRVSFAACIEAARAQGWPVLLAGFGAASGGWFINQTNKLYGPEFTAFLGNLIPAILVLTGLLSGERLRLRELFAVGVTIAGAFVFSYRDGQMNWSGIGLMVAGCVLMSMKKSLMKHATGVGHLPSVMTLSLFLVATWGLIGAISSGSLHFGTARSIGLCVAAGISGAMIGMSLLYAGLNVVGLARGAPIDSLRPLAVVAIGMITGTALPARLQLLGGAMVLIGSAALAGMGSRRKELERASAPVVAAATKP
ncbi:MAG TPA: DMT family transporter [Terriglobales bacterium]|nr:DMT family transporter [Terriglobales bacterium]